MPPSPLDLVGGALSLAERASRGPRTLALQSVERVIGVALQGPLVEAVARDLVRYRVLQRVADPLVASDAPEQMLALIEAAQVPQRIADKLLEDGIADAVVARLLESEELWVLVDEIASSPAVTDAISHQSAGVAEQMAVAVRDRSRTADARLERIARRALRRGDRPAAANGTPETIEP